ncbi:sodium:solute symporter family transporter [Anaerobaca lacustris]|uniref:Uncharacterized protein n=1 Tax=Anaerobaca lacustris TaxID=3044600 RepID=A0AAW6U389_9BACT|nr:hypothetical protein [Sedimentisphaerales bacterium M17dextr]
MELALFDVVVFLAFFAMVIGTSLFKSKRETSSEDYFLAGRGLTWWLIGISIVAANISTEQFVGMAGQGAGDVGLAVSSWQLVGSVGIVIIAFTLLPRFLKAGIYTMPEYLEYRYNSLARAIMALITVVIYVIVLLCAVLYSGGLTLRTIFGLSLTQGVWLIGVDGRCLYRVGRTQGRGLGGSVPGWRTAPGWNRHLLPGTESLRRLGPVSGSQR